MAHIKEMLIGYLRGVDAQGAPAVVSVYQAGRGYRISHGKERHLCHPSVRSIQKVKAEALLAFHVRDAGYEAI